jgi:hypothetical protein
MLRLLCMCTMFPECRGVERSKQIDLVLTEQRRTKNGLARDDETKQQFKAEGEGRESMSVVRVGVALSEARDLTIANNLWWEVIEGRKGD